MKRAEINKQKPHFKRAKLEDKNLIFNWLDQPHVNEFWDNSQAHRDDIERFLEGNKQSSFGDDHIEYVYWIGYLNQEPYCFLLTSQYKAEQTPPSPLHSKHYSQTGNTYSIDFCIGNSRYLGKGLAAHTLQAFTDFFKNEIDNNAGRFLIDPDENNPRAIHVYHKAGFRIIGRFAIHDGFFKGQKSVLMVKDI